MNIHSTIKSACALAMLSLPSLYAAEDVIPVPGYMANVQVALKARYETPGTFVRDENGEFTLSEGERIPTKDNSYITDEGKTLNTENIRNEESFRFGNREILELLLENEALPEGEKSIRGWSLKQVSDGNSTVYYAYKKGKTPVNATPLYSVSYSGMIGKSNLKTKVKLADPKGAVKSTKATGEWTNYSTLNVSLGGNDFGGSMMGKVTLGFKNIFPADSRFPLLVRTMKASHLSGTGGSEMGDLFFEGNFSTRQAVLVEDLAEEFSYFRNDG